MTSTIPPQPPPSRRGVYTQAQVDEIVHNRLEEQAGQIWADKVDARLAELTQVKAELAEIKKRQVEGDAYRKVFFRVWAGVMVVGVPTFTVVLQHFWGPH
jgi:hypothetical protein